MASPLIDRPDQVFNKAPGEKRLADSADYVIIGSGPSGAAAARALCEQGHDVIMIEEGKWPVPAEFDGTAFTAQKNFFREMGTIAASGKNIIPIIQGRCVGGGSVINAAIIWRLPGDVYERWDDLHGISKAVKWSELEDAFETLETELNVKETSPKALGRNNALLKKGADKLGIESRIIPRNERGCKGLAQCLSGCPAGAKQSADLTYVPYALDRGARVYCSCRARHIDVKGGRARTVHATFEHHLTGRKRGALAAHAKKGVIVCASPVQTPLLLMRSGIGMTSGHLGRHFMGHPGAGLIGLYPEEVRLWEGATQGWDSEHYRKTDRVKFEALSIPPDLMAARLPGLGAEFKKIMDDYARLGNVGCAVVAEAEGRVRLFGNSPVITYSLTKNDMASLRKGLRVLAEVMFAAGAEQVLPGIFGLPPRVGRDELDKIAEAPLKNQCYTMVVTHLFGTARIGEDPAKSVVGHDFQVHDTRGVYVLDSSFFPSNIGVNPQHSIMGFAMAGAKKIGAS